jgi:uncharacterized OB-fold protein
MSYTGPLPSPTEETQGFWDACRDEVFTLHRCAKCGACYFPASACTKCDNDPCLANMKWEKVSGKGKIFSFVVCRRMFHPSFPPPFVYGLIELDEGPLIPCGIDVDPEAAKNGMPVEVYFQTLNDEFKVPRFRPPS